MLIIVVIVTTTLPDNSSLRHVNCLSNTIHIIQRHPLLFLFNMFCLCIKREKINSELIVRENESSKRFSPAPCLTKHTKGHPKCIHSLCNSNKHAKTFKTDISITCKKETALTIDDAQK